MWTTEQTSWLHVPQRYERIAQRLAADVAAGALAPGEKLPGERDLARRLEVSRSSVREAIASLVLAGVLETRPGSGSYVASDGPARAAAIAEELHDASAMPARTLLDLARPVAGPADASPAALLEARLAFEPPVVALAAARAQPDARAEELLATMEALDEPSSPADRQSWNEADRLFHRQLAAMADNPVLLALADVVARLMDQPLWQSLRDDSVAVPGRVRLHVAEHRLVYEAIVRGDADASRFLAAQHLERVRRYMTLD